jgi:hypothetical protein
MALSQDIRAPTNSRVNPGVLETGLPDVNQEIQLHLNFKEKKHNFFTMAKYT